MSAHSLGTTPTNSVSIHHAKIPFPFVIHDDMDSEELTEGEVEGNRLETSSGSKHATTFNDGPSPLTTTKLGNLQVPPAKRVLSGFKKQKVDHSLPTTENENESQSVDAILAKLYEQRGKIEKQKGQLVSTDNNSSHDLEESVPGSVPLTPATDTFVGTPPTEDEDSERTLDLGSVELARLQKELNAAKDKIARQEQELSQTRVIKHTLDQVKTESVDQSSSGFPDAFHPSSRLLQDDTASEFSDVLSPSGFNRGQNIWNPAPGPAFNQQTSQQASIWNSGSYRPFMNRATPQGLPPLIMPGQQQRNYNAGLSQPNFSNGNRFANDHNQFQGDPGFRRSNAQNNRVNQTYGPTRNHGWDNFGASTDGPPVSAIGTPTAYQTMGMYQAPTDYQPRPIGTPLSATAAEFNLGNGPMNPWNPAPPPSPGQTYVSPMEPLNYRRLLDRSVTCNWKYIVDKIVCNNDQQASIFLQQKLKIGTVEQKYEIVEAIVAQAYPLMVNRFGNFLVQRCFEHGTSNQVIAIANAIRGNTLSLSMDAFGCHVVQKAFDVVPEDFKAVMVHELLRRIPETVIHRYACHVWQKLFELRWSDSPPQIMKFVNEALRGMWHEVALGETGSLVVQNIFENCLEEDKRPCINEVLARIDIVAHGQFGNWCIQHICEHGAPADRIRAIDHVLRYATEYSMDQFASKVVEKCLKIGGAEFLERYLERVCEGRSDRPRIPLIDIASDQYGNYLIQYILTHANTQHREAVASHIRKHMVSLRGSKFGSRVGMLCCNPAYATRPGPAIGPQISRLTGPSSMVATRYYRGN